MIRTATYKTAADEKGDPKVAFTDYLLLEAVTH
jgi:hypothetical protein